MADDRDDQAFDRESAERRRATRVSTSLGGVVNHHTAIAIRSLSLERCIVEAAEGVTLTEPLELAFTFDARHVVLRAHTVYPVPPRYFGLRFASDDPRQSEQLRAIIAALDRIHKSSGTGNLALAAAAVINQDAGQIANLSECGCFIKTGTAYRHGEMVEIRVDLDGKQMQLRGQVRRKTAEGIGVEFVAPGSSQIRLIAAFIARVKARPTVR